MTQRYRRNLNDGAMYPYDFGQWVLYGDHEAALATEKRKVEDLANTIERLMLRAELRHDGLYHIRFTAEAYEALAGLHARYLESRRSEKK